MTASAGLLPRSEVTAIALEFGTLPIGSMLRAVRADAWLHAHGELGAVGKGRVERADGEVIELGATAEIQMRAGDVFVIETPGGGGFGAAH